MRGRRLLVIARLTHVLFQSTPPCGGDRKTYKIGPKLGYFNPRPHAGATPCPKGQNYRSDISIHAPMRGRRRRTGCVFGIRPDFNPRPHAGATQFFGQRRRDGGNFNPRPHAGATDTVDRLKDVR